MDDLETYVDAAAGLLGLPIDAERRPGVLMFMGLAAEMAAILEAAPLDEDELAPLPVYLPPSDAA